VASPRPSEYWLYGDKKFCVAILGQSLRRLGRVLGEPYSHGFLLEAKKQSMFKELFIRDHYLFPSPRSEMVDEYLYPVFRIEDNILVSFIWLQLDCHSGGPSVARGISIT